MVETEQNYSAIKEATGRAAAIPYNTAASYWRMAGVAVDTTKFGSDCVGKLSQLKEKLPEGMSINYLVTGFRSFKHVGAVVDNAYYVDPFLFLTEPISLAEVINRGEVVADTLADNQKVKASFSGPDHLVVRLTRSYSQLLERTMIEYHYDLNQQQDQLPSDQDMLQLSSPYLYHFVSAEGRHLRMIYDVRKNDWKLFLVNGNLGDENFPADSYTRNWLGQQYNLSLEDLAGYFSSANEIQKYLVWQQRKNGRKIN